jgi:Spy/CpxP family protein refolding chaperone
MKSRKYMIVAVAAVAALTLISCYRTPEQRAEHMVTKLATELKLDSSQTAKLEKIKDEFLAMRPGMINMRIETVREANDLMRGAEIDKARLNALVDKNQAKMNEMVRFVAEKFTEIHDMLTPEQREKLVMMIEKHMTDK